MGTAAFSIRRATAADGRACFGVFRRALADLMRRIGYLPADEPDPDIDERWPLVRSLFDHLARTAAEWWVAEDGDGRIIGYARSIERSGAVELTEFFVAPGARVAGIGQALLERAFAPGTGSHRSVIATVDAPAVALYLRFGMAHQTTAVDMAATPRAVDPPAGYELSPATLEDVAEIDADVLGYARLQDLEFMLADRPAVALRRDGELVAHAFLRNAHGFAGPVSARDPRDLPAALAVLEHAAHEDGQGRLDLTVPLAARAAVDWLLSERGWRIDPFYSLMLADGPGVKLDRHLPFNPSLIL